MEYYQEQPDERLREYVRCYWVFENKGEEEIHHTIMPDGFFDILICFYKDELDDIILTGLWTQRTQVIIMPGSKIYGIQFRLRAIETIIQENIASLLNDFKSLGKDFHWLSTDMKNSDIDFFKVINSNLCVAIDQTKKPDQRKIKLLNLIDQSKGNHTIAYYASETCWSSRQINRYFNATFGLPLKSYCSIRKGASSFSQIKRGQLFPNHNYFDQSHFIKEIKKITGATPKVLNKNKNDRFLQFSIIRDK